MVWFFGALLTYALLTFGAVLPQSWLIIAMVVILGFAVVITRRILRHLPVTPELLILLFGIGVLFGVGAKPAVGVLGGAIVWAETARSTRRAMRLFDLLIILGVLEALLGLVQFFISPGWILGYMNSARSTGSFINRNHFAGLLSMIVPLTLGYAFIGLQRFGDVARSYVYLLAGAFMATALVFSLSRSGIFAFLGTLLVLGAVIGLKDTRTRLVRGLVLGLLVLVIGAGLWIGLDIVVDRYAELLQDEAFMREGRMIVFRDTTRMIAALPLGVGYGNYQDIFRKYQTFRPELLFDHAHNDYLEMAAEFGLPAAILFWGLIVVGWGRMIQSFLRSFSPERSGILLGCAGSVGSILIHSLADFNLQIPANAMLFFAIFGTGFLASVTKSGETKFGTRE